MGNISKLLLFYPLVWKDDTALYFPNGQTRPIHCNHVNEGTYGVNIRGEAFPLPTTTIVPYEETSPPTSPPVSPPNSWQGAMAMVNAGHVYGEATPFPTDSANYKICVKIKDMVNLVTSYVDADSYAANVVMCNPSD